MGKFCVLAKAPCNEAYAGLKNVIIYETDDELREAVQRCLLPTSVPARLTAKEKSRFDWKACTQCFVDCL